MPPTPRAAPGAGRQPPVQRPATSPYFARPFIPTAAGHVLPACADASPRPATRASSAWSAASSASRPATGASARREGAPRAARWSNMTLGDVLPLFDPNINHFSMRRSEGPPGPPLSAREPLQRPRTSSTAKSFAADAAGSQPAPSPPPPARWHGQTCSAASVRRQAPDIPRGACLC